MEEPKTYKELRKELATWFEVESEYTKNHKIFMINEIIYILEKLMILNK